MYDVDELNIKGENVELLSEALEYSIGTEEAHQGSDYMRDLFSAIACIETEERWRADDADPQRVGKLGSLPLFVVLRSLFIWSYRFADAIQ